MQGVRVESIHAAQIVLERLEERPDTCRLDVTLAISVASEDRYAILAEKAGVRARAHLRDGGFVHFQAQLSSRGQSATISLLERDGALTGLLKMTGHSPTDGFHIVSPTGYVNHDKMPRVALPRHSRCSGMSYEITL